MASSSTAATTSGERIGDLAQGTTPGVWHKSAPSSVRKAAREGDAATIWPSWSAHLAQRIDSQSGGAYGPVVVGSLYWAIPKSAIQRGTPKLLERLAGLSSNAKGNGRSGKGRSGNGFDWPEEVSRWMVHASAAGKEPGFALEAIGWCRALPALAAVLPGREWWALLTFLLETVAEAQNVAPTGAPLVHQLLAGELAFELACGLPELEPCRELVKRGREALGLGMSELLDGNGMPHADNMDLQRPLLACWTRCAMLAPHWKKGVFSNGDQEHFEWAVRHALLWTRADGSQALGSPLEMAPGGDAGSVSGVCESLFHAALSLDEDDDDRDIAALVLSGGKKSDLAKIAQSGLPDAACNSEWSAAAVLRTDWRRTSPSLWVHYSGRTVRTELSASGRTVWSGPWAAQIRRNGRVLEPATDWEEICWVSDEDADYLELEAELTEGLLWQRQMLLARDDGFLWLADCILGDDPARLEYASCLPLGPGVTWTPAAQTREGLLSAMKPGSTSSSSAKPVATVLPLTLPEWKDDHSRAGALERVAGGLELRQSAQGNSICAAMFFDLDPRRANRKLTWRHLTVAESLEIQPDDVAVGQRVQIGREQWLFYRSLALKANRTLLGHNLSTETLVARFDAGEVEALLEVE